MKHILYSVVSLVLMGWTGFAVAEQVTVDNPSYYEGTVWTGTSGEARNVVLTMNHDLSFSYSYMACSSKEDSERDCQKVSKSGKGWQILRDADGELFLSAQMVDSPKLQIVSKKDETFGVESTPSLAIGDLVLSLTKQLPKNN